MLCTGLAFTACSEDDEYTKGAPAGAYAVSFDSESNMVMELTQNEVEVTLARAKGDGELTVPLEHVLVPECVTAPTSVTFKNGETSAAITLTVDESMKMNVAYQIRLAIPEEYTNPYAGDAGSPVCNITILKEDYEVVAYGIFEETLLFGAEIECELHYSPSLNIYRMPSVIEDGYNFYFYFDGEVFYFTDAAGNEVTKFESGYVDSNYGMVSVNVVAGNAMGWDPEGYFYFPLQWTVSAGSFGAAYDYFVVTEWLKKPWEAE